MPMPDYILAANGFSCRKRRSRGDSQDLLIGRIHKAVLHIVTLKVVNSRITKACFFVFMQHILILNLSDLDIIRDLHLATSRLSDKYFNLFTLPVRRSNDNCRFSITVQSETASMINKIQEIKKRFTTICIQQALFSVVQYHIDELHALAIRQRDGMELVEKRVYEIFKQDSVFGKYFLDPEIDYSQLEYIGHHVNDLKRLGLLPLAYGLSKDDLESKKHLILVELILKYQNSICLNDMEISRYNRDKERLYSTLKKINQ